mgnify:FL=1
MKHTLKVTIALVLFFFIAQFIGLLIINHYIDHKRTFETKKVQWQPLPYNIERPEVKNQSTSFIWITIAILVGTFLVLLLIRFNKPLIWKFWFFASVFFTLLIAFGAFMDIIFATTLALLVSVLKLYKPNIIIQNLSEIFIYGGLAAFVVNIFNLFAVFALLIVISIYDFLAVYMTKHMIKLAKFQSKSNVFAGLYLPYEGEKVLTKNKSDFKLPVKSVKSTSPKKSVAVLGGGDIGFTLIFAGVVMKDLMLKEPVLIGFSMSLIIPTFATIALLILLLKGKHNKFYPAMPLLSAGCFIGYLVILLI